LYFVVSDSIFEELRREISKAKHRWSDVGKVTKNLLSLAPPCVDKPLVPAAFAVFSTHQPAQGPCGGLWPVTLCVIHMEGLSPSSGDINRLMMISLTFMVKKQY
jgi:hypothetical protein